MDTHYGELFFVVQEIISKWRGIRDNYTRTLRKSTEQNKSGSGAKKPLQYVYEKQLTFLNKCRESRPTTSSIDVVEVDEREHTDSEQSIQSIDNDLEITETIVETERTGTFKNPPRKKTKKLIWKKSLHCFL